MRIAAIVLALALAAPAPAAGPAPAARAAKPPQAATVQVPSKAADCPRTTSYYAGRGSMYRDAPLTPKKLIELPSATTYMAVVRKINGCEIPLTMTEYRTGRRP